MNPDQSTRQLAVPPAAPSNAIIESTRERPAPDSESTVAPCPCGPASYRPQPQTEHAELTIEFVLRWRERWRVSVVANEEE